MLTLFRAAAFLGAALLFVVQPMFAHMALPRLGGSPAVWNTAMVFYQTALLVGYAYAHFSTAWLGARRQAWLHLGLLALALAALPVAIPPDWSAPANANPVPALLALMAGALGLPLLALSATGPLLQAWLASSGHRAAPSPYFLFGAGNLGGMAGLLAYPTLVAAHAPLRIQSIVWTAGFAALLVLMLACAVAVHRSATGAARTPRAPAKRPRAQGAGGEPVGWRRRLRWMALAFVPSSLMLGVTHHLSTEVAALPMLWVAPLALYLLSFVLTFARRPALASERTARWLPFALFPAVVALHAELASPLSVTLPIHAAALFATAVVCHGALSRDRPPAERLTGFYLCVAAGGAAGGMFNALAAPLMFRTILEYPLVLLLAFLVGSAATSAGTRAAPAAGTTSRAKAASRRERALDLALPLGVAAAGLGLAAAVGAVVPVLLPVHYVLMAAPLGIVVLGFARRPLRCALGMAAILFAGQNQPGRGAHVLHTERTFFGVHRVICDTTASLHVLYHGAIVHGMQNVAPGRREEPLGYYHPGGPIGQVFQAARPDSGRRVAVVGLGAGTLAAYGRPGDAWTFYEIDPAVVRIAVDPAHFTYLADTRAEVRVVLGDARQSLAAERDRRYDLIVLDAFSSDAIPVHLMTREAVRLYVERLSPGGLLAFHVSNRYFDLVPVVAGLARDAGLVCRVRDDPDPASVDAARGIARSTYALLARGEDDLGAIAGDPRWMPGRFRAQPTAWTDERSNPVGAIDWRQ